MKADESSLTITLSRKGKMHYYKSYSFLYFTL